VKVKRLEMRLLNRTSQPQRLGDTINDSLDALSGLKPNVTRGKIMVAGLVAGSLAGLTAASAGISSLRRRMERARDDS
jgi:hypothetical protein